MKNSLVDNNSQESSETVMEQNDCVNSHSLDIESTFPRITAKWLRNHCRKHGLYQTPQLNEVLYLQHQGFKFIELLEDYVGLKSLWLDHNCITKITGLHNMKNLKCLFIRNNFLTDLRGIECLEQLVILDVSNNLLTDTNALVLPNLTTLYVGSNKLSDTSGIDSLARCKTLSTLDLSRNMLKDSQTMLKLLIRIRQLSVLYLHGNPLVRNFESYRAEITTHCINLKFLDDKPIRENDRFCAKAWMKTGMQGMKEEKIRQKDVEDLEMHVYVMGKFKHEDYSEKKHLSSAVSSSQKEIDINEIIFLNLA
ncbi:dynein axonemal assembly factor 1-like isoform X2 [Daphnia magna]|uniref:dynein axonemal assembly factor 1-like isoform X2 n=1 Tax=Daphnia magna TaxID=35525 RepID=UPI0014035ED5|nr:dynein axonemal assembly factor 1-like isoform X2 [Daphnia magna]